MMRNYLLSRVSTEGARTEKLNVLRIILRTVEIRNSESSRV